jgi:hypothetical protein
VYEKEGTYRALAEKPEEKRQLGRSRRRLDDIRMYFQEMSWECVEWIDLARDTDRWRAIVDEVMNLQAP